MTLSILDSIAAESWNDTGLDSDICESLQG